jgi:hypothetical protein
MAKVYGALDHQVRHPLVRNFRWTKDKIEAEINRLIRLYCEGKLNADIAESRILTLEEKLS